MTQEAAAPTLREATVQAMLESWYGKPYPAGDNVVNDRRDMGKLYDIAALAARPADPVETPVGYVRPDFREQMDKGIDVTLFRPFERDVGDVPLHVAPAKDLEILRAKVAFLESKWPAARPTDPVEPTDAQIAAYLKTNDAYWHETDQELPTKPGQWRSGNVKEATRVSLRAALAARPADPVEPSGSNPSLLASPEPSAETLREMWEAYSTVTEKAHEAMRLLYRIAVRRAAIATPAEPSVRAALEGGNPEAFAAYCEKEALREMGQIPADPAETHKETKL